MKKIIAGAFCIVGMIILLSMLTGATYILKEDTLTLAAVDATPLDGSTADRTYLPADRDPNFLIPLSTRTDAVDLYVYSTSAQSGADGNSVILNIYGYGDAGPTVPIYVTTTFTLGTATSPGTGKYADTVSGTDVYTKTVGIADSGNNRLGIVTIETTGLSGLYVEPNTFTGVTGCVVVIRQYGLVK